MCCGSRTIYGKCNHSVQDITFLCPVSSPDSVCLQQYFLPIKHILTYRNCPSCDHIANKLRKGSNTLADTKKEVTKFKLANSWMKRKLKVWQKYGEPGYEEERDKYVEETMRKMEEDKEVPEMTRSGPKRRERPRKTAPAKHALLPTRVTKEGDYGEGVPMEVGESSSRHTGITPEADPHIKEKEA